LTSFFLIQVPLVFCKQFPKQKCIKRLERNSSSSYFRKIRVIAPKYLRKFTFDKMIELEIPESVADFIEGRVPKRIGTKHYLALARQSSKFYPRYAEYIDRLSERPKVTK